jgi:hypothetical protein
MENFKMNAAPVSSEPTLALWNVKISPCNTTKTKWEIHVVATDFEKANGLAVQWIAQNLPTQVKRIDGIPCANCDEVCSVSRIGSGAKSVFPYVTAVMEMSGLILFEPALKINERIAKWLKEVSFEDELAEADLRQDLFEDSLDLVPDHEIIENGAKPLLELGDIGSSPFDDIFDISVTSVKRLDSFVVMDEKIVAINPRSPVPTGSRRQ